MVAPRPMSFTEWKASGYQTVSGQQNPPPPPPPPAYSGEYVPVSSFTPNAVPEGEYYAPAGYPEMAAPPPSQPQGGSMMPTNFGFGGITQEQRNAAIATVAPPTNFGYGPSPESYIAQDQQDQFYRALATDAERSRLGTAQGTVGPAADEYLTGQAATNIAEMEKQNAAPWQEKVIPGEIRNMGAANIGGAVKDAAGVVKDTIGRAGPVDALGAGLTTLAGGVMQAAQIPFQRANEVQITRKYDELTQGNPDATFGPYLPTTVLTNTVLNPVRQGAQTLTEGDRPGDYEALQNWLDDQANAQLITSLFENGYGGEQGYGAVYKYYNEQQGMAGITADVLGDPFLYAELGLGAAKSGAARLGMRAGRLGAAGRAIGTGLEVADALVFDPLKLPKVGGELIDAAIPGANVVQRASGTRDALGERLLTQAGKNQKALNQAEQNAAMLNQAVATSPPAQPWLFERDAAGRVRMQTVPGGHAVPLVRDRATGVVRPVQAGDVQQAFEIARNLPHERAARIAGTPTTLEQHLNDWMALVSNPRVTGLPREIDFQYPSRGPAYQLAARYTSERILRNGQAAIDGMYGQMRDEYNAASRRVAALKALPAARRPPTYRTDLKRAQQGIVKAAYTADRIEAAMEIAGRADASARLRKAELTKIRREARAVGGYRKGSTYAARLASGATAPVGGTPTRLRWSDVVDVVDDETRQFADRVMADGRSVGDMVLSTRQDLSRLSDLAKQMQSGPLSPWDQQEFAGLVKRYQHLLPDGPRLVADLNEASRQINAWTDTTVGMLTAQDARRQIGIEGGMLDKKGNPVRTGIAASDSLIGKAVRALDGVGSQYRKYQLYNPFNILRYSGLQAAGNAVTLAIGDAGALQDYTKAIVARARNRGKDTALTPADQILRDAGIGHSPYIKSGIKDDLAQIKDGAGPVESMLRAGRRFAGAFDISLREAAYMHRFQPKYRALQMGMKKEAARRAATMGVSVTPAELDAAFQRLDALHPRYKAWQASELKAELIGSAKRTSGLPALERPLNDVAGEFMPRTVYTPALDKAVRAQLDRLGLSDVAIDLIHAFDKDIVRGGGRALAKYSPYGKVISISRTITDGTFSSQPEAYFRQLVDHEAIHALRHAGAFTDDEWRILKEEASLQKSRGTNKTYYQDVRERYSNIGGAKYHEEAVAHLFADWKLGRVPLSPQADSIFQKLWHFLQGLGKAMRGSDAEEIFEKIESGEIGRRTRRWTDPNDYTYERLALGAPPATRATGLPANVAIENWADRVARDYANGVRTLHKDALANVNRLGFSFEETKVDALLGKVFMYHYWSSRANMLYTREMLGNPALLNGYVSMWKTLDREAEKDNAPPWLRGFYAFMQTPMGLTVFANPTALLNTFAIFNPDILGEGYDGNLTGLGKARQRSPFMINPVIDQLLFQAGLYGSGASAPNIMPISGAKLYDWLNYWNAHTDTPVWTDAKGNPVPPPMALRTFGGRAVSQFLAEKISPQTKELADRLGIPADVMQFGDMASSQRQDLVFLMMDVLREQNPGLDDTAIQDLLVDEHGGGFDTGDPVYQQALDRYAERAYAGILEGRDVPNAVRGLIDAASPFGRIPQVTSRLQNDADINSYFQAEDDQAMWADIRNGTVDEAVRVGGFKVAPPSLFTTIDLGGTVYTPEDLAALTPEERAIVADAWFQERNPGYTAGEELLFPESALRASEIARAANPDDLATQEAEDAFYHPGTPEQNEAAAFAKSIRDGQLRDEGSRITVTIDGQSRTFDNNDLARMTAEERKALAALWTAESGNGELIDGYYAARDALVSKNPDIGGYFAMKDIAGQYPGGALAWVEDAIKENPTTYGQYAERLDPNRYPPGTEDWAKKMLSLEGYQALTQQRPSSSAPFAWEDAPGAPVIPGMTGASSLPEYAALKAAEEEADQSQTPDQIVGDDLVRVSNMLAAADAYDAAQGYAPGTSRGKIIDQIVQGEYNDANKIDKALLDELKDAYPSVGKDGETYGPIPTGESFTRRYIVWALGQPEDQRDPGLWSAQDWLTSSFQESAERGLVENATGQLELAPEVTPDAPPIDFLNGLALTRGADGSGVYLTNTPPPSGVAAQPAYAVGGMGGTLYLDASVDSQPIIILGPETPLQTVESLGDWVHVVEPGGLEGWMRKGYLSSGQRTPAPVSAPTPAPTTSAAGSANAPLPVPPSQRPGGMPATPAPTATPTATPVVSPSPTPAPASNLAQTELGATFQEQGRLLAPQMPTGPAAYDPQVIQNIDTTSYVSPNRTSRNGVVPTGIVYHYTVGDLDSFTADFMGQTGRQASANYVVDRDGTIYQFVDPDDAAWTHGDVSNPRTDLPWLTNTLTTMTKYGDFRGNLNTYAIGIEIVNSGNAIDPNYEDYTPEQMAAVAQLTAYLVDRYGMTPGTDNLIGHEDVSDHKSDPGPKFDWNLIYHAAGVPGY